MIIIIDSILRITFLFINSFQVLPFSLPLHPLILLALLVPFVTAAERSVAEVGRERVGVRVA